MFTACRRGSRFGRELVADVEMSGFLHLAVHDPTKECFTGCPGRTGRPLKRGRPSGSQHGVPRTL